MKDPRLSAGFARSFEERRPGDEAGAQVPRWEEGPRRAGELAGAGQACAPARLRSPSEGQTKPMGNEMDEYETRVAFAELSAQRFVIEVLLARELARMHNAERDHFISEALRISRNTGHLEAGSDEEAERVADVAVQTQQRIEKIFESAKVRAGVK